MPKEDDLKYDSLLIPSYEEATSSRPSSSLSHQGTGEAQDAERQGLLGRNTVEGQGSQRRNGNYHTPTVESARSSYDSALTDLELSNEGAEDAALRRDMEEMEVDDPAAERRAQQRGRLRERFSKSLASLSGTFSSMNLPTLPVSIPSLSFLTSRLPAVSDRYKPSWPIIARLVAIAFIAAVVYGVFFIRILSPTKGVNLGKQYIPESFRTFVQSNVDPNLIEHNLRQITADDHVAGTKGDFFLAEWVKERFEAARLDAVWNEDFQVYLNYPQPRGRRVEIIEPENKRWTASLEENIVDQENLERHQTLVYHGHSRSGNVTGPLVYANYGSFADFEFLKTRKIDVTGSIVIMRYYGTQPDTASKVKAAEVAGAIGCLVYSDPADDGFARGAVWPEGPWRTSDSVHRDSVALTSYILGDPLTPGWPSVPGAERISEESNPGLVNIPSLPLSWQDARELLRTLDKHGEPVPRDWIGAIPEIGYYTGHISSSPIVNLVNLQDSPKEQPIRNVLGKIEGIESPESEIYIGNHRDAWCFGSVDPGSGTAVFLEVVRIFGELMTMGWRPRRSLVFASWDAGEYNHIGSTEHVESRIDAIRLRGLAYLNVDVGVSGSQFRASGAPIFARPLHRVLSRVSDPDGQNMTLADRWTDSGSTLGPLGASSDYVAFQDLAGCSSLDLGFSASAETGSDLPTQSYPYHSCYETLDWLQRFADPIEYSRHVALAQVWALLILELSDEPVLSFDMRDYAQNIWSSVEALREDMTKLKNRPKSLSKALEQLDDAAKLLSKNTHKFEEFTASWEEEVLAHSMVENRELAIERISHNAHMGQFDSLLLDLPLTTESDDRTREGANSPDTIIGDGGPGGDRRRKRREHGLPGRRQYKHVVHGPSLPNSYKDAAFPGVRDALSDADWPRVEEQLALAAERVHQAARRLLL
ncbi:MAG: hypothetical protein M1828_001842 [Chrysothrix sp. TS-e1954]|nr:MAG: hypothetical protein M1828_001842 [Chrysothrix sp. TS-e1954]